MASLQTNNFVSYQTNTELRVSYYNGVWQDLRTQPGWTAVSSASSLSIETISDNDIYVAYKNNDNNSAQIQYYNGTNWSIIGSGSDFGNIIPNSLSFTIDTNHNLYLALEVGQELYIYEKTP